MFLDGKEGWTERKIGRRGRLDGEEDRTERKIGMRGRLDGEEDRTERKIGRRGRLEREKDWTERKVRRGGRMDGEEGLTKMGANIHELYCQYIYKSSLPKQFQSFIISCLQAIKHVLQYNQDKKKEK